MSLVTEFVKKKKKITKLRWHEESFNDNPQCLDYSTRNMEL